MAQIRAFEMTVTATPQSLPMTSYGLFTAQRMLITVSADCRFRIDGGDPTPTTWHPLSSSQGNQDASSFFRTQESIQNFRIVTATTATAWVTLATE